MEQLIEAVKRFPILFDVSNENYVRVSLKNKIWSEIAIELGYKDGQSVKTEWQKLRDCHRDALRRQKKTKSGQAGIPKKLWTYQKQMEFLILYMTNRQTTGNMSEARKESEENSNVLDVVETGESSQGNSGIVHDTDPNQSNTLVHAPSAEQNPSYSQNKKRKTGANLTVSVQETLANIEKRAAERDIVRKQLIAATKEKENEQNDALHQFFQSMYKTTKEMPIVNQLRIKKKIFEAISQEEEELIGKNLCNCPQPTKTVFIDTSDTDFSTPPSNITLQSFSLINYENTTENI